jgi:hypothetical protein
MWGQSRWWYTSQLSKKQEMKRALKLWIGLAEVVQKSGKTPLGSVKKAACVNVVGLASDPSDFSKRAAKSLSEAEFDMIDLEDLEPFSERVNSHKVDTDLRELAREAEIDGQIKFGIFHTYPVTPKACRVKPPKKGKRRVPHKR